MDGWMVLLDSNKWYLVETSPGATRSACGGGYIPSTREVYIIAGETDLRIPYMDVFKLGISSSLYLSIPSPNQLISYIITTTMATVPAPDSADSSKSNSSKY